MLMLGVGNGFCKTTHNNNALLKQSNSMYLIDCGVTAWLALAELGLGFEEIEGIFITHLHYDHCGGLDEAALYGAYQARRKMKLWLPSPLKFLLWDQSLRGTLENVFEGKLALEHYFEVKWVNEGERFHWNGLELYWLRTEHVPGKFSCSLIVDRRFFYSSDMRANVQLMQSLAEQGIQTFWHDASFRPSPIHASVAELLDYPEPIRRRMFLMHYGQPPDAMEPESLGGMTLLRQQTWMEI